MLNKCKQAQLYLKAKVKKVKGKAVVNKGRVKLKGKQSKGTTKGEKTQW